MKTRNVVALVLTGVVAAGVAIGLHDPSSTHDSAPIGTDEVVAPPLAEEVARGPSPPVPENTHAAKRQEVVPNSVGPDERSLDGEPEPPAAELRVRFLLEDGTPAKGVKGQVHGWGANQQSILQFGEPENWEDPTATSDEAGLLVVRFDPPRAYQFTLDAKLEGYGEVGWRWGAIQPGETNDLGEVVLLRGGAIRGRIVDVNGNPLLGEQWMVYAESTVRESWERDETGGIGPSDPTTGAFLIEDVPPGRATLKANSHMANWIDGPEVVVVAGDVVEADIVYEGPDNSTRITVYTFSRPFHLMDGPDPSKVRLVGNGIELSPEESEDSCYSFDRVPPGLYSVVIDDPRFEPWRKDGITPGSVVDAELKGTAALRFSVTEKVSGDPIESYAVRVLFRNVNFSPREFEVHDGSSPLPGDIFEGMFEGDYEIAVGADGFGSARLDVDGLERGETREVAVSLGEPRVASGRVLRADGRAVPNQKVTLLRPAAVNDSDRSRIKKRDGHWSFDDSSNDELRHEVAWTVTDANGRYEFEIAVPGSLLVYTKLGWGMTVSTDPFTLEPGEVRADVDLIIPRGSGLSGRVLGVEDSVVKGLRVAALPEGLIDDPSASMVVDVPFETLDRDGRFEFDSLPSGTVQLFLILPEIFHVVFEIDEEGRPIQSALLGRLDLAKGQRVDHDFALDRFPGTVDVDVLLDGEPLRDAFVGIGPAGGTEISVPVDGNGRVRGLPSFPGDYELIVSSESGIYRHPSVVRIESGQTTLVEVVVELVSGTVTLVNEGGEPMVGVTVLFAWADDPEHPINFETTSEAGELSLTLSPGNYVLIVWAPEEPEAAGETQEWVEHEVWIEWTRAGPTVEQLVVR